MTVVVAFSSVLCNLLIRLPTDDCRSEEAGHYLTTYKQFEFKPPDLIKERAEKDYYPLLRSALTTISKVNKTDVETLRSSFGVCSCLMYWSTLLTSPCTEFCKHIKGNTGPTAKPSRFRPGQGEEHKECIREALSKPSYELSFSHGLAIKKSGKS